MLYFFILGKNPMKAPSKPHVSSEKDGPPLKGKQKAISKEATSKQGTYYIWSFKSNAIPSTLFNFIIIGKKYVKTPPLPKIKMNFHKDKKWQVQDNSKQGNMWQVKNTALPLK